MRYVNLYFTYFLVSLLVYLGMCPCRISPNSFIHHPFGRMIGTPILTMRVLVRYCFELYSYKVQYSTVQYSTVRYSTVRYGTVRYGTVRYGTVQYGTVVVSSVK